MNTLVVRVSTIEVAKVRLRADTHARGGTHRAHKHTLEHPPHILTAGLMITISAGILMVK